METTLGIAVTIGLTVVPRHHLPVRGNPLGIGFPQCVIDQ
jgi:hypothetical protein